MDIKAIIQKQFEDFNRHNADAFVAPYAPNATCYDPYYEHPLNGREAIYQDVADFFQGFPTTEGKVVGQILLSGNSAAFEVEITGSHKGSLASPNGPIPPTNRDIRLLMGRFIRFTDDGKILSDNRYYDTMSIMVQLGLMTENAGS